ncbi:hypothetical protein GCM10010326_74960 [Streptomyces xanthochromogenes]|uniref:Uncharacterized protein n=1 Tax=Streptomyces xanthochromogenes TaxID=67384 RepID=A0ABQ3AYD5_9ACTN|nr:hypothetical protein GCM10010326_74960 [Streptomyces xanthochromogenes]
MKRWDCAVYEREGRTGASLSTSAPDWCGWRSCAGPAGTAGRGQIRTHDLKPASVKQTEAARTGELSRESQKSLLPPRRR